MGTREVGWPAREYGDQSVETEVVFQALANRRRRLVVRVLDEATEPLSIGTLATRIAAYEQGVEPVEVTHRQRKSVYTSLHQNHLPKLTDAGFVTADREWVDVRLTERAAVLESHLYPGDSGRSRPLWSVSLVTGLCTTAAVALHPTSTLPTVVVASAVAVLATLACYWLSSRPAFYTRH